MPHAIYGMEGCGPCAGRTSLYWLSPSFLALDLFRNGPGEEEEVTTATNDDKDDGATTKEKTDS